MGTNLWVCVVFQAKQRFTVLLRVMSRSHMLHVWNIYLHMAKILWFMYIWIFQPYIRRIWGWFFLGPKDKAKDKSWTIHHHGKLGFPLHHEVEGDTWQRHHITLVDFECWVVWWMLFHQKNRPPALAPPKKTTKTSRVIQFVTKLSSPIVGGHQQPFKRALNLTIPKKSQRIARLTDTHNLELPPTQ